MTGTGKKVVLQYVPYICYPVQFKQENTQTLLDFESEVIIMTPIHMIKLGFTIRKIDVGTQKINSFTLVTYEMVIVGFSIQDRLEKGSIL